MSDDEPSATEAFEQLRSEVALLRRAIEGLAAATVEAAAPDYSPTLAGLRKAIDGLGARIETLAANPPMTAAQMAAGIAAAGTQGRTEGQRDLAQARTALEKGVRDVVLAAGAIRAARVHRRRLIQASLGGAALGIGAWIALSGPIARALPHVWHVPERMAAATLGLQKWPAGNRWVADCNR